MKAAGAAEGIVDFGMRALLSMRLEKNLPTWFAELRPIYGPFEGGMERFVRLDKPTSSAGTRRRARRRTGRGCAGSAWSIEAEDADVMGDEPIWARTDRDWGAVAPPHGYRRAALRRRRARRLPAADAARDGDWRVVGWVTSGGYGH